MSDKVIFKFPKDQRLFTAMWAQISGMADCCGAGVIGRLAGILQPNSELTMNNAGTLKEEYKKFTSMRDYVMLQLPRNQLFAGPPEWLHWAICEDLLSKKETGIHTPKIKAEAVQNTKFDFEANPYHKFWAGPSYRVQMWFITDRQGKYMSHAEDIACKAFVRFLEERDLATIWKSGPIPGAYGMQKLWGAVIHPNYDKIRDCLPDKIKEANEVLEARWKEVAPQITAVARIKDKVARKW